MSSTARIGERRYRLHRVARQLDPRPEQLPYYLALPPGPNGERAAGWYMVSGRGGPIFLGANAFAAELDLTRRVELQRDQAEQRGRRRRRRAAS